MSEPTTFEGLPERIRRRIERTETCWLWRGQINPAGYGRIWGIGRRENAHRFVWMLMRGPIPAGLEIDHLCRVRNCVNPDHLEVVTHRENSLRSPISASGMAARKTHCPQGHPYNEANTMIVVGFRRCRICWRARQRRNYHRRQEARAQ